MTGPVTTEAWAEARELVRQSLKGGAPGLTEATRNAVVGSIMLKITNKVLAPLLAALQQVTAERDEEKARADRIDAKLGELNAAVRECLPPVDTLIAERQAAEAAYATATSELARLRAEGEALRAALKVFAAMSAMDPPESVPLNEWLPAITGARAVLNDRTALARAATAREGAWMAEPACLEHRHIARCSDDLKAATAAVEAWGRQRWPGARVIHELRVGGCRLDIAFVQPDHIAGVEIKSAKDTLTRLPEQVRQYMRELPEVWVALAPKFVTAAHDDSLPWSVGRIVVDEGRIGETIPCGQYQRRHDANPDVMLTAPMLHLLWRDEALWLAKRHGITVPPRLPLHKLVKILARRLTGDEIVSGVCRALRGRPIRWTADPPIVEAPTPALNREEADRHG